MKSLRTFRFILLALLVLAGSSGFGPRNYTHPRHTAEVKNHPTAAGQIKSQNQDVTAPTAAPASGQKPEESEAVTLTHSLVESVARGVKAVGETFANILTGLAVSLLNALFSLFGQRSMY